MLNQYAIVFPGQGSQAPGMLAELAQHHVCVNETFQEASDVLGYDLWAIVQTAPAEQLNQTIYTQPALLTTGVALWRIWQTLNFPQPRYVAGHSLGEYSALVAAQALDFSTAVKLVQQRAEFMQAAVPEGEGAMAAIVGLSDEQVLALCEEISTAEQSVEAANFNAIGQVVVAGHLAAVTQLMQTAKEAGAKLAKQLPMSVPSHCRLMQPAAKRMTDALAKIEFATPQIDLIHNVDLQIHKTAETLRTALVEQLTSPVRWVETIQKLVASDISLMLEAGPGKVLMGLNRRIDKNLASYAIYDVASLQQVQLAFTESTTP